MKNGEQRASSCHAPSARGSKNLPAGLSKVPLRESARRYIRRRGSVSGMWRRRVRGEVLDIITSRVPRAWSPERKSGGQKGFRPFSLGVLIRGHGTVSTPPLNLFSINRITLPSSRQYPKYIEHHLFRCFSPPFIAETHSGLLILIGHEDRCIWYQVCDLCGFTGLHTL